VENPTLDDYAEIIGKRWRDPDFKRGVTLTDHGLVYSSVHLEEKYFKAFLEKKRSEEDTLLYKLQNKIINWFV
jgi:hypothetical protein